MKPLLTTLLPALAVAALTRLPAQESPPGKSPAKQGAEKLAEWPAVSETERAAIVATTQQFAKPEKSVHEPAHKKLVAQGDAAAPLVMLQVNDRTPEVNERLFAVLDVLLQPRHSALMAREVKKPRVELRRYLTLRLVRFVEPELVPVLQELRKDKDELTAFYASLGALALQQRDALPAVATYTKAHWAEVATLVAEVLPSVRSRAAGEWGFEAIAKASATDQMAGLRLLRYMMVKEQGALLKTYLNASDHSVLREAINAARVVHGETPLENLPVFQVVKHKTDWLKKL